MKFAASAEEIKRCFPVMHELRPKLADAEEFFQRVRQQESEGFQLAYLECEGEVVCVAGFRMENKFATGLTLYVDDLVTAEKARSQGYGKAMLDALIAHAKSRGCATFSLDSGSWRKEAHAFYFREGMRITSFHFELPLS